ncbi:MAG: asparagine synthase (glutamine-hydrolyzing) [Candidatus Atribacteria bacterium]|nr:asparagine synthase (glutamine-hydrolyzing) [Candidatus Atribacteria bacterium]
MTAPLIHRGPDEGGIWIDPRLNIALGHRRLSILDLTMEGHQPMVSPSGRWVIVYNGEVYNFAQLRRELENRGRNQWKGHSDTEVMLVAFEEWGLLESIQKFVGMFAFALLDREERVLYLVRDRLGIKPLYYGWVRGSFLFGSELKALKAFPNFPGLIDRNALALYLRYNYIPAPFTIYQGISKLLPGTFLKVKVRDQETIEPPIPYWSAREIAEKGLLRIKPDTEKDSIEKLEKLLLDSISLRMVADVPLGAFLSGGIDSSTVVSLMQKLSSRPIKTFTIGFQEDAYNEARDARAVARHLGTEHTELYVTPEEARAVIPRLPDLYDEPFSDSSQIPTYLVSQLARQQVVVSLSGDGGDELFGGYNRYFLGRSFWKKTGWMPGPLKKTAAGIIECFSPRQWDSFFSWFDRILPGKFHPRNPGEKIYKLADILRVSSPQEMYLTLISHWKEPGLVVNDSEEPFTIPFDPYLWANQQDLSLPMMFLDLITYLPDDILTKVDRASMGVSLEARVPLLDHRIVEYSWTLPLEMKLRNGQGKWILRQILYQYVPKELIERPKMGFGIPLDKWLRGGLREWAGDLLPEKRLSQEGFFNPVPIRKMWEEHQSGERNWQNQLWDVLMFQAWLEKENI